MGNEIRDTCDEIHRKQYKQLRKIFIPLCLESHGGYYFNILRMITIFYNLYVEHEIYSMANKKERSILHYSLLIQNTTSKCDYDGTWGELLR